MSLVLLSSPCFLLKALKYLMSIDLIAHKSLHKWIMHDCAVCDISESLCFN